MKIEVREAQNKREPKLKGLIIKLIKGNKVSEKKVTKHLPSSCEDEIFTPNKVQGNLSSNSTQFLLEPQFSPPSTPSHPVIHPLFSTNGLREHNRTFCCHRSAILFVILRFDGCRIHNCKHHKQEDYDDLCHHGDLTDGSFTQFIVFDMLLIRWFRITFFFF